MQPVATVCEDKTFTYTQLHREGMIALYAQQHKGGGSPRFEVVILRHMPASTLPSGATLPEREAYPRSSQWGQYGWTFHTREEAERWVTHLLQQQGTLAGRAQAAEAGL